MSSYRKSYNASVNDTYYESTLNNTRSITVINNSRYYMCFNFGSHIVPIGVAQSDWYIPPFSEGSKNIDSPNLCFKWFTSTGTDKANLVTTPSTTGTGNADVIYSSLPVTDGVTSLDATIEQVGQVQYGSTVLSNIAPGAGGWQDIFVPTQDSYLRFLRVDVTDSANLNGAKFYIVITNAAHTITYYWLMGKYIYKNTITDVTPLEWDMRSALDAIPVLAGQVVTVQAIAGLANELLCTYAYSV